jgi:hypothetical protein
VIDVSELINDPDFSTGCFHVLRNTGTWVDGVFCSSPETLTYTGTVRAMTSKEIQQLDIGDAVTGGIVIWTLETLYPTTLHPKGDEGLISDTVYYQGQHYKVLKSRDLNQHGYRRYQATLRQAA